MGNCLVTKLSGTVQNSSLPVFGKILTTLTGERVDYFTYQEQSVVDKYRDSGSTSSMTVDNSAYFYNRTTQQTIGNVLTIDPLSFGQVQYDLIMPNGSTTITYDKYTAPFINGKIVSNDSYEYSQLLSVNTTSAINVNILPNSIISLAMIYGGGDFNHLTNIKRLAINNGSNYFIDVAILSNVGSLSILSFNRSAVGNIESLSNITGLSRFEIISSPLLTGSLDNLFTVWATAGKTGNMIIKLGNNISLSMSQQLLDISDFNNHTIVFGSGSWSIQS